MPSKPKTRASAATPAHVDGRSSEIYVLSIEDRLHSVRRAMLVIEAAAITAARGDDMEPEDVCDAIAEVSRNVRDLIEPILSFAPVALLSHQPVGGGAR